VARVRVTLDAKGAYAIRVRDMTGRHVAFTGHETASWGVDLAPGRYQFDVLDLAQRDANGAVVLRRQEFDVAAGVSEVHLIE